MGALDVDFTIPIVLLAGAIAGVVLVRQLTRLGAHRAKARTARLLERQAAPTGQKDTSAGPGARAEGIEGDDRASHGG